MNCENFFRKLWRDFTDITPQAVKIRALFEETDGDIINDHVAFRTFSNTPLQLKNLEPLFLEMGYERQSDYVFEDKKLRAYSYMHSDPTVPKIFCSEILTDQLSEKSQEIIAHYTRQIQPMTLDHSVFWSARHWEMPSWEDYQTVMEESEYAAWLLVIGIRVNHFTVSVNHLTSTNDLQEVLQRIKEAGFAVNSVGGEVKGSPEVLLEQGSTLADRISVTFAGGDTHEIPSCFYEFARRYDYAPGCLYQGFIAANADKIFESTNAV